MENNTITTCLWRQKKFWTASNLQKPTHKTPAFGRGVDKCPTSRDAHNWLIDSHIVVYV